MPSPMKRMTFLALEVTPVVAMRCAAPCPDSSVALLPSCAKAMLGNVTTIPIAMTAAAAAFSP